MKAAVGVELLHPVVAPIDDVHGALVIHRDAPRHVELALAAAEAAPLPAKAAVLGVVLNAVVQRVDHVQVAVGVEGHARRAVELPGAGTVLAPLAQVVAGSAEHRDAVAPLVGDVQHVVAVQQDVRRPQQLAVGVARTADDVEVFVVPGETADVDRQRAAAQDVQPPLTADRQIDRVRRNAAHAEALDVGEPGTK